MNNEKEKIRSAISKIREDILILEDILAEAERVAEAENFEDFLTEEGKKALLEAEVSPEDYFLENWSSFLPETADLFSALISSALLFLPSEE